MPREKICCLERKFDGFPLFQKYFAAISPEMAATGAPLRPQTYGFAVGRRDTPRKQSEAEPNYIDPDESFEAPNS